MPEGPLWPFFLLMSLPSHPLGCDVFPIDKFHSPEYIKTFDRKAVSPLQICLLTPQSR